jgi:polyhomeotic-like protein 1
MQNAVQQQQQQQIQQQIAQMQMQQQQQFMQQAGQGGIQNAQLIAQGGNIQQVVLQQHPQQMPTVTVTSGVSMHQSMPSQITQQGIMTKAGAHQILMQPVTSQNSSAPPTMASNQIVTSVAGTMTADTSNSILGPLTSPQTPLQPPQNPLIAMTTLSASPMSGMSQKDKSDAASGDTQKSNQIMSVTLSPMKRPAEDSKQSEAKKPALDDSKKPEDSTSVSTSTSTSSPSTNKTQNAPSTPNSSAKPSAINSPLAAQNGETEVKKNSVNSPMLKNELPKAMVKPNVLTHVIEGYVIQESNEPFPVTRQRYSEKENDEPPKKKQAIEEVKANETVKTNGEASASSGVTSSTTAQSPSDMIPCEHCGKQEMRSKMKKKRFCSLICSKSRKSLSTDSSPTITANNGDDKPQVAQSPSHNDKLKGDGENGEANPIEEHVMLKWSVAQVCDFIKNLPGCSDYAEDFKLQEIDGQALLLLKENHLVSAMGMKLGPALKIVNKIESMRVETEGESTETPPEQQ